MSVILSSLREVIVQQHKDLCANTFIVFDMYMFWIHKINKGL